jgi:hypothetical protein
LFNGAADQPAAAKSSGSSEKHSALRVAHIFAILRITPINAQQTK